MNMSLFANLNSTQRKLIIIILAIIVYVISAAGSYSLFAANKQASSGGLAGGVVPSAVGEGEEDPNAPKVATCPLNGNMHTQVAKDAWEKRRPLAVMIENHQESRPQSGLTSADVVYEAVAEGGITRFMAMYYCVLPDVQVGPVRSARTYYLDWLSEYDALYAHVGGANTPGPADALGQIIKYDIKDLNQFSIGFPTFWRDYQRLGHPVATEHTMYSTTQKLWAIGEKRGWGPADEKGVKWDAKFVSWKFVDGKPNSGQTAKIEVPFWESQADYKVVWNYDATCNCYKRDNGGAPHMDLNKNIQVQPKVVIVRFQRESAANDGYEGNAHRLYGNKGQGKAVIFQNGQAITGTWRKADRLAREKFFDDAGKELELVRGQIWLQTVPDGVKIVY
jgi:hypothetical protein